MLRRYEILPGNVGYLALEGVPPLPVSRAGIDAFAILQQTEALILDNRENHGGAPATVAYYTSYLLESEPFVITRIHHRADVIIDEISTVSLGRRSYGASRPERVSGGGITEGVAPRVRSTERPDDGVPTAVCASISPVG